MNSSIIEHLDNTGFYRLRAGQVITIEPGVYVPADSRYPKEFHGIGIRIEVGPLNHYTKAFFRRFAG